MSDRRPGLKFVLFSFLCVAAAAYISSVTGNVSIRNLTSIFDDRVTYSAELADVAGLYPGDQVRLAGVPVGRVESIDVERGNAVVEFAVEPDVVPTDTWEAGARWRNVIGQRYLYLYDVEGGQPLAEGARIPVERTRPVADISAFFNELTPLLEAIDPQEQNKLLGALNTALVGREGEIQELATDLGSLGNTIADEEATVERVLDQGNALLAQYNERSQELSAFLADFASVGGTLRARNDELIGAITDIGEVQAQFGDLVEGNDEVLIGLVEELEVITASIGDNRGDFEESLSNLRDGFATYNLISRYGQWFNVRIVATQVQSEDGVIFCRTEAGTSCSEPNSVASAQGGGGGDEGPGPPPPPEGLPPPPDGLPVPLSTDGVPLSAAPVRLPAADVLAHGAMADSPDSPDGLTVAAALAGPPAGG